MSDKCKEGFRWGSGMVRGDKVILGAFWRHYGGYRGRELGETERLSISLLEPTESLVMSSWGD
jgi:hypothetical protein